MGAIGELYQQHGFWAWAGLGAALLAIEIAFGSGYLLWPAAAAGIVALIVMTGVSPGLPAELGVFAVLTIASSLMARRFFKPEPATGPDINDTHHRLVGHHGDAVGPFRNGQGRVFVDGKEWAAEAEGEVLPGDRIEVIALKGGASLKVRRAAP